MQSCCRPEAIWWIKKLSKLMIGSNPYPFQWNDQSDINQWYFKCVFYFELSIRIPFTPTNISLRKTNLQGFLTENVLHQRTNKCINLMCRAWAYEPPMFCACPSSALAFCAKNGMCFFPMKVGWQWGWLSINENGRIADGRLYMIAFSWLKLVIHCG